MKIYEKDENYFIKTSVRQKKSLTLAIFYLIMVLVYKKNIK